MILLQITKIHRKHLWQSVFFVYNVCERLFLFGSTRIMELIISEAARLQVFSRKGVFPRTPMEGCFCHFNIFLLGEEKYNH